ncbi:MAG TPA: NfeD family protein [Gaiellaceae bacterium]|nr:NfeD family protein [Gaiellaceae bacterium]
MLFGISVLLAVFVLPHPWGLFAVAVGATLDIAETGVFIWWSQRRKASVGVDSMVGKRGVVVSDLWPEGQIKIGGERWRARCDGGCESGTDVVVRRVEGLTLVVEPVGS